MAPQSPSLGPRQVSTSRGSQFPPVYWIPIWVTKGRPQRVLQAPYLYIYGFHRGGYPGEGPLGLNRGAPGSRVGPHQHGPQAKLWSCQHYGALQAAHLVVLECSIAGGTHSSQAVHSKTCQSTMHSFENIQRGIHRLHTSQHIWLDSAVQWGGRGR